MILRDLIKDIKPIGIYGDADIEIAGVDIDSRQVADGHLFVAIKGTQTDGHQYIAKAIELGAVAVLCEDLPAEQAAPSQRPAFHPPGYMAQWSAPKGWGR